MPCHPFDPILTTLHTQGEFSIPLREQMLRRSSGTSHPKMKLFSSYPNHATTQLESAFRRLQSFGVTELHDAKRILRARSDLKGILPSHLKSLWQRSTTLRNSNNISNDETSSMSSVCETAPSLSPVMAHLWHLKRAQYKSRDEIRQQQQVKIEVYYLTAGGNDFHSDLENSDMYVFDK